MTRSNPRLLRAGPGALATAGVDSFKDAVASAGPAAEAQVVMRNWSW